MPFIDADELPVTEPRPGWKGRFFHSASMTFGYWEVAAGASVHEHSHANEEVWHVIDGRMAITVEGVEEVLDAGCAAIVPADALHSARALSECRAIVANHPTRYDVAGGAASA